MVSRSNNDESMDPFLRVPSASMNNSASASDEPFTLLHALIMDSVKGMTIPGQIIKLRNWGMTLTVASLGVSLYEVMRYSLEFGPLPVGDSQVLAWVVLCLIGSLLGTVGTFIMHKGLLLAASLAFCCAMAPATPNMIVLSEGDQCEYFIGLALFMFLVGGVEIALYASLSDELNTRENLMGQPSMLGDRAANQEMMARNQPCGCLKSDPEAKDNDYQNAAAINACDGNEDAAKVQAMCPKCHSRIQYVSEI